MAECEPPTKKSKHEREDFEDIFETFHDNNEAFDDLKGVLNFLEGLYCGYGVCLAKIHVCNAICKKSFSNATCEIHAYTGKIFFCNEISLMRIRGAILWSLDFFLLLKIVFYITRNSMSYFTNEFLLPTHYTPC